MTPVLSFKCQGTDITAANSSSGIRFADYSVSNSGSDVVETPLSYWTKLILTAALNTVAFLQDFRNPGSAVNFDKVTLNCLSTKIRLHNVKQCSELMKTFMQDRCESIVLLPPDTHDTFQCKHPSLQKVAANRQSLYVKP